MEQGKKSARIRDYSTKLDNLQVLDWPIGIGLKSKTVSKGFSARVHLPQLTNKDIMFLYNVLKVSAWIVRIKKVQGPNRGNVLGYLYAQIVRKNIRNQKMSAASLRTVSFRVVYAAAAPSKRFENFTCPAFGHNKEITDIAIDKKSLNYPSIGVSPRKKIISNVHKVEISEVQLAGGASLRGTYAVDLALYDPHQKNLYSDWIRVNEYITVSYEKDIFLPGCANFQIPARPKDTDAIRQFKLKR